MHRSRKDGLLHQSRILSRLAPSSAQLIRKSLPTVMPQNTPKQNLLNEKRRKRKEKCVYVGVCVA